MFEDYKKEVLLTYKKRRDKGTLPHNLQNFTPANLKRECLAVFHNRYSKKDEETFKLLLNEKRNSAEEYFKKINATSPDIFKPLCNFLKGNTSDTKYRNIEFLAWLLDFEPRPYTFVQINELIPEGRVAGAFKKQEDINEDTQLVPMDNINYVQPLSLNNIVKMAITDIKEVNDVFISYSWDNFEHEEKVIDFTNHLRKKGFSAVIDKMLNQEETAINFVKMMYKAINGYSKIIVVLSRGYKEKADKFKGGVGTEYELLINDITNNPNKYILASFEGRGLEVIPDGLKGRDIVDLSSIEEETRLFEKLLGHKKYVFSEVAAKKPELATRAVKEFSIANEQGIVVINEPVIVPTGNSSSIEGKYKSIDFTVAVSVTNNTVNTISGFAYTLKICRELDLENYSHADADGFIYHELANKEKLYPKQTWRCPTKFPINISSRNIHKIIDSILFISVFTEQGHFEAQFSISELIKIRPADSYYAEAVSLSAELFV